MFDSLNDEIKKSEGAETSNKRRLLYVGAFVATMFGFWALYAGIRYME